MKIFKYPFPIQDRFTLKFSRLSNVLCVQMQRGTPTVWVAVDPEGYAVEHVFYVRGTGHQMGDAYAGKYVGTFQYDEAGTLVFHLFYGGEVES